ncbi:MAG: type II toxin-antitoxin system HicB family antitoxin [Candidatus Diapherotrites archaeon]|nr:type II toxin-antitoxin system HicB family antitoxin [Candidatus Diapherotrites archaeon]
MPKLKKEKVLNYTAVFEPQPEGGYTVTVPALPGCISEGDNLEEAREMIADAVRGYCESLLKDNLPLPKDAMAKIRKEKIRVVLSA